MKQKEKKKKESKILKIKNSNKSLTKSFNQKGKVKDKRFSSEIHQSNVKSWNLQLQPESVSSIRSEFPMICRALVNTNAPFLPLSFSLSTLGGGGNYFSFSALPYIRSTKAGNCGYRRSRTSVRLVISSARIFILSYYLISSVTRINAPAQALANCSRYRTLSSSSINRRGQPLETPRGTTLQ